MESENQPLEKRFPLETIMYFHLFSGSIKISTVKSKDEEFLWQQH